MLSEGSPSTSDSGCVLIDTPNPTFVFIFAERHEVIRMGVGEFKFMGV
jgi:hypothetical protein